MSAFKKKSVFPEKPKHQKELEPFLAKLSKKEMEDHLTTFTSFHTRYYKVCAGCSEYHGHADRGRW
jgi:leucyl aminopeptidase